MIVCRQCGKGFATWGKLPDGRLVNLQQRRFCLSCSPYGARNTYADLRGMPFAQRKSQRTESLVCGCGRSYIYDIDKANGHTRQRCNSCTVNWRRKSFKRRAVEAKGGKCNRCGYNRCIEALQFHHVDKNKKNFNLTGLGGFRPWKETIQELKLCVLLCSNCHAEEHSKEFSEKRLLATISKQMAEKTASHAASERKKNAAINRICSECGKPVYKKTNKRCWGCWVAFRDAGGEIPKADVLSREVDIMGFEGVGEKYGLTGAAIKKRLVKAGLYIPRKRGPMPKAKHPRVA